METTERIVEAYVRYVKGWATIPNVRGTGQEEIDLLAIDPKTLDRYHIESGVSISGSFSKLTNKPFDPQALKKRGETPEQRRTLGYFLDHKFRPSVVLQTLAKYGFVEGNFTRVIVSWGWTPDVPEVAKKYGIVLWDFRELIREIAEKFEGKRSYFTDDTLRTLHLFSLAASRAPNGHGLEG